MTSQDSQLLPIEAAIGRVTQANTLLHNADLEYQVQIRTAELRQQVERERILSAIASRIRASLNLQDILNTTVNEVRQLLQADRVLVYQFDGEMNGTIVAESVLAGWTVALDINIKDTCFRNGGAAHYLQGHKTSINNIYQADLSACHIKLLERFEVKANLVVPIVLTESQEQNSTNQQLWGLLIAHQCETPRWWEETELDLLDKLAVQIAIAVQQAKAFTQLQQFNQELEARVEKRTAALRQTNERLAITNQELIRATQLKDEFLANMSHELRTPLTAILGLSEVLQEEVYGTLNHKQHQSLKTIEASGQHLLNLINDILDLAKIESGKFGLQIIPVSIPHLCKSSLALIKHLAQRKNINLECQVSDELLDIAVDERRIQQVLINLLSNAVKFTPNDGTVKLVAQPGEKLDELTIAVIDTGIGIAAENMHQLFQPFVQIDSSLSRRYAGTGLGLALARQIVELHGGRIKVESMIGYGSCFTVILPWNSQTTQ